MYHHQSSAPSMSPGRSSRRRRGFGIIAAALLSVGVSSAAYDCDGPNFTCDTHWAPACGEDGTTYQNDCFAECQGVSVAAAGKCDGDGGRRLHDETQRRLWREDVQVSMSDLNQFMKDGFTMVGVAEFKMLDGSEDADRIGLPEASSDLIAAEADAHTPLEGAVRVTPQGFLYVSSTPLEAAAFAEGSPESLMMEGSPPVDEEGGGGDRGGRRLQADGIVGVDDRGRVQDSTVWPFSTIGHLLVEATETGAGRFQPTQSCSGALIGRDAVLTAAHCVHEGPNGAPFNDFFFVPGRDSEYAPYGTYSWKYASYPTQWTRCFWFNGECNSDFRADIALLILDTDSAGRHAGDSTGWLGYGTTCTHPELATSGYPGDKEEGTMWTVPDPASNGACLFDSDEGVCNVNTRRGRCDIYSGQSGSPVYAKDRPHIVHGVVSHVTDSGSSPLSGMTSITRSTFEWIYNYVASTAEA